MNLIGNLKEFHRKIGAVIADKPTPPKTGTVFTTCKLMLEVAKVGTVELHESLLTGTNPTDDALSVLRLRLMIEELSEVADAMERGDLVDLADGLADLQYVVVGTAVVYGIPLDVVHEIVHASNMSKTGMDEHSKGGKGGGYMRPEPLIRTLLGT